MFRFGSDRVEYNQVGPSRGHKIHFFLGGGWSGSGQDIYYGALQGRGAKNLAPQDSNFNGPFPRVGHSTSFLVGMCGPDFRTWGLVNGLIAMKVGSCERTYIRNGGLRMDFLSNF